MGSGGGTKQSLTLRQGTQARHCSEGSTSPESRIATGCTGLNGTVEGQVPTTLPERHHSSQSGVPHPEARVVSMDHVVDVVLLHQVIHPGLVQRVGCVAAAAGQGKGGSWEVLASLSTGQPLLGHVPKSQATVNFLTTNM